MDDLQLHDAVVFLAAAALLIPVARRLRISPVLGFLLIGIAIGPHGLAQLVDDYAWLRHLLITNVDGVRALAELGVVFLLFMIGLELSFERLWGMRRLVFGLGSAQIVVTAGVIGVIAFAFGNSLQGSLLLGSCLALSSTAIVTQLLIEQNRLGTTVGRSCFAVLLAQDMAVVPILFLVGAFGAHAGGSILPELAMALGEAVIAVLLIFGIGRLVVRPLLAYVGGVESPELFMAVTLLLIIAIATATHAAGLSAALGAFLAGLLLAETEYRHEIQVNIEPFKGLLLGVFFMSVGMGIDLTEILTDPMWIALSILGLFAIKTLTMALLARAFRIAWHHAVEAGLLLGQGGEFAFVVVGLALSFQLMPSPTAQFMLIVVGATMFLTPLVARLARITGNALRSTTASAATDATEMARDLADHVIIVGYGRTGELLADLLERQQIPYVALDLNADRVHRLQAADVPIRLGDASRWWILEKFALRRAAVLAICTDDPGATEHVLAAARRVSPTIPVVARARDTDHAVSLLTRGANRVVPELLESGLQLGQLMLEAIGYPATAAHELIETRRTEIERRSEAESATRRA